MKTDSKILNCVLKNFSSSEKEILNLNVWMFSRVILCLPQSKVFHFKNTETLFIDSLSPFSFVSPECVPSQWVVNLIAFNLDISQ